MTLASRGHGSTAQDRSGSFPTGPKLPARTTGVGLIECLLVMVVGIIVLSISLPRATSYLHESRLRGAAFHLRGLLRQARARAIRERRHIGIVFDEVEGDPALSWFADGNGNGIRRRDIGRGLDPRLRDPWRLSRVFPGVRYGSLPAGADEPFFPGLRIGRSKILSFSPIGVSTSGTLFLSNEYGIVYAVVILGSTGRIRVARFRKGRWQTM